MVIIIINNSPSYSSKFRKILLIKPNYKTSYDTIHVMNLPPINLTFIASYLTDLNVKLEIIDAKLHNLSNKKLKKKIIKFNPDVVGITVFVSATINICYEIAKLVKEVNRNCIVVLGGRHPTFKVEEVLKRNEIDIVVRNEGEITFRELIIKGSPREVNGLSYKINRKVIHNPDRTLLNYASIRIPARFLINHNKYYMFSSRVESIETSRGCPFSCKFCTTPIINYGRWRPRPVEKIISELKLISRNQKIKDIFLVDDNFAQDTRRIETLCDRIIECKKNNEINDLKFLAQIRVDSILKSPQMVKKMAAAGFWVVLIGIETIREDLLLDLKKGFTIKTILKALEILHQYNIIAYGNLIIGLDLFQNKGDMKKSINFVKNLDIDIISFSLLTPFPGTPIYQELKEEKLIVTEDWSKFTLFNPVIKTYTMDTNDLLEILIHSIKKIGYIRKYKILIPRLIKTRGLKFLLNPIRIIALIKSYLKVIIHIRKFKFMNL